MAHLQQNLVWKLVEQAGRKVRARHCSWVLSSLHISRRLLRSRDCTHRCEVLLVNPKTLKGLHRWHCRYTSTLVCVVLAGKPKCRALYTPVQQSNRVAGVNIPSFDQVALETRPGAERGTRHVVKQGGQALASWTLECGVTKCSVGPLHRLRCLPEVRPNGPVCCKECYGCSVSFSDCYMLAVDYSIRHGGCRQPEH